jgi:transposase
VGLFLSGIAAGLFIGPGWLLEHEVRMRKAGSKKSGNSITGAAGTGAAGIDTGKDSLDAALAAVPERLRVANDDAGHAALAAWLTQHGVRRVGIEASGGYERAVVRRLRDAGFAVIVFQPAQVRAYAGFRLQRAKTDPIDAALIAACAAAVEDERAGRAPPDPRLEALAEQLTLVEQIEEDLVRAKTRLEAVREATLKRLWEGEIRRLKGWRAETLKALGRALRRHADLAKKLELLSSVPGIGERTALALLIRLPEIGTLSREEAAALAGLAPFDNDSGRRQAARHVAGGRDRLRKSLYAAALPAAFRWNDALVAFYQRLTKAGKPHKLALVACARKLLVFANAVLARGTPWTDTAPAI